MAEEIKQGIYRHYRGGKYSILYLGYNSENKEEVVVYQSTADGKIWVRLKKNFLSQIEIDGKKINRFEYVGNQESENPPTPLCQGGENSENPPTPLCQGGENSENPPSPLCQGGENSENPPSPLCQGGENSENPPTPLCQGGENFEAKYKRAIADYQNLLKQTAREKMEFAIYANEQMLKEILPVYDHLKMAIEHCQGGENKSSDDWLEGVKHVIKQFKDVLEKNGVEEVKIIDKKFDHNTMEAISNKETNENKLDGLVARQIKAGYKLNGKIIEAAKVAVYKVKY
ncbi:nucleotide exchange factor GrpE [Patescibacteria group bacterium]|nr:nucleotide exchange factor GrpE [Patescibacteria group bacterium]